MALKDEIAILRAEVTNLREEIEELRRWQSWVTGIAVGIGVIITFFANGLRKRFGLN